MSQRPPTKGTYLFFSDDAKTIALVYDTDVPASVREFIEAIASWVSQARRSADLLQEAIDDGGTTERPEGSDDGDLH